MGKGFFIGERKRKSKIMSKIMTRSMIMIRSMIRRGRCEDTARAGAWIAACDTHGLGFEVHARALRRFAAGSCGGISGCLGRRGAVSDGIDGVTAFPHQGRARGAADTIDLPIRSTNKPRKFREFEAATALFAKARAVRVAVAINGALGDHDRELDRELSWLRASAWGRGVGGRRRPSRQVRA
jgi:hypothetical protein